MMDAGRRLDNILVIEEACQQGGITSRAEIFLLTYIHGMVSAADRPDTVDWESNSGWLWNATRRIRELDGTVSLYTRELATLVERFHEDRYAQAVYLDLYNTAVRPHLK